MLYDMLIGPVVHLGRTALVGVLAYVTLVFALRVSGKRTLSKLNAFDLVVTVALGSCLATILLSKDTSLLQGAVAYAVLIVMQLVVAWASSRSQRVNELVKSSPALLFYRGEVLQGALRRERLTEEALRAAARASGVARMESVDAIVLESDGSITVLHGGAEQQTALEGVKREPDCAASRILDGTVTSASQTSGASS
jgi:uncharacterized membrane protein YcaP (DUF421 family)